jgi:hypothetical protein
MAQLYSTIDKDKKKLSMKAEYMEIGRVASLLRCSKYDVKEALDSYVTEVPDRLH